MYKTCCFASIAIGPSHIGASAHPLCNQAGARFTLPTFRPRQQILRNNIPRDRSYPPWTCHVCRSSCRPLEVPPMDSAFRQSRARSPDPTATSSGGRAMAGGQAADLPASAPGSLSSSPVRTGGISLSSRTAESRRLVEGRRRTWVVESTEAAHSPSEHSPLSDWGPATDARSDTDCESQSVSPSPQRGWLEQTGWDTTSALDKLVALPRRGPSPLSARNGEQSSPFSFGRSSFSCDAPKRSSPVERRAPA